MFVVSLAVCVPCRYVASTEDTALVPRILRGTNSESLSFVMSSGLQTSRRVTSEARYDKHDVIADLGGPVKPVIPTPLFVEHRTPESWISIGTQWTVSHQQHLINEARLLAGRSLLC